MASGREGLRLTDSLIDPSRRQIAQPDTKLPWAIVPAVGVAIFWGAAFAFYALFCR